MDITCGFAMGLFWSSFLRLVGISSVTIIGLPTLVAPMNWSRLGWRTREAMSISLENSPWWNSEISWWRYLTATLVPLKSPTFTSPHPPFPRTSSVTLTSSLCITQWGLSRYCLFSLCWSAMVSSLLWMIVSFSARSFCRDWTCRDDKRKAFSFAVRSFCRDWIFRDERCSSSSFFSRLFCSAWISRCVRWSSSIFLSSMEMHFLQ